MTGIFAQYSQLLQDVSVCVDNILQSPQTTPSLDSSCNCADSESCYPSDQQFTQTVTESLQAAGRLDIHAPQQNRRASELLNSALLIAGENAEARIRYLASGEKYYYDYIYFLSKAAEKHHALAKTISYEDQNCLWAVKQLAGTIVQALEEKELLTAAELMLRLADVYFAGTSYMISAFGIKETFALMDQAEKLLELAHLIALNAEQPQLVWQ